MTKIIGEYSYFFSLKIFNSNRENINKENFNYYQRNGCLKQYLDDGALPNKDDVNIGQIKYYSLPIFIKKVLLKLEDNNILTTLI